MKLDTDQRQTNTETKTDYSQIQNKEQVWHKSETNTDTELRIGNINSKTWKYKESNIKL